MYGTLRRGFGNHTLMGDSEQLGTDTLNGFEMFTAGGFPVVYPTAKDDSIVVEVFEVTEDKLTGPLDMLEGHPRWYKRELVPTVFGDAWMYIMTDERYKQNYRVESGDWSKR